MLKWANVRTARAKIQPREARARTARDKISKAIFRRYPAKPRQDRAGICGGGGAGAGLAAAGGWGAGGAAVAPVSAGVFPVWSGSGRGFHRVFPARSDGDSVFCPISSGFTAACAAAALVTETTLTGVMDVGFQTRSKLVSKPRDISLVFGSVEDGNGFVSSFVSARFPFPRLESGRGNERSRLAGQFVFSAIFGQPARFDGCCCHLGNLPF